MYWWLKSLLCFLSRNTYYSMSGALCFWESYAVTFASVVIVDEAKTLVSLFIFFHGEVLFSWFAVFVEEWCAVGIKLCIGVQAYEFLFGG